MFYKDEPVLYFDSLKTSSLEGAATTVYAQGGKGNTRLMAWEGERTLTFTMEDALISPEGFMILSGAGLIDASAEAPVYQHMMEQTDDIELTAETSAGAKDAVFHVYLANKPFIPNAGTLAKENFVYIMAMKNGEVISEPFLAHSATLIESGDHAGMYDVKVNQKASTGGLHDEYKATDISELTPENIDAVLVDYYVEKVSKAKQIEITPDKFGGNYYLEASTLFRDVNGVDLPAEFIIPNCKVQSNFTFTMASSGDPSTFTFTMDAFPDYTRFDKTQKVLAAIQVIDPDDSASDGVRTATNHE